MDIIIPLITQFLGMIVAVKVLGLKADIIGIVIFTVIPMGFAHFFSGILGFSLSIISLFFLVKFYDDSASFIKIVGILVICAVIQMAIYQMVILPAVQYELNSALSDGKKITIQEGVMTIE